MLVVLGDGGGTWVISRIYTVNHFTCFYRHLTQIKSCCICVSEESSEIWAAFKYGSKCNECLILWYKNELLVCPLLLLRGTQVVVECMEISTFELHMECMQKMNIYPLCSCSLNTSAYFIGSQQHIYLNPCHQILQIFLLNQHRKCVCWVGDHKFRLQ